MGAKTVFRDAVGRNGWWIFILALLAAVPGLACRLVTEGVVTPAPSPTAFAVETASPLRTATAEPRAVETSTTLTTFASEELGLTFQYPASWALDESDDIPVIASDERMLGDAETGISGAVVLFLVDDAEQIATGALDRAVEEIAADLIAGGEVTDGPETRMVNGQEAAMLTVESEEQNGALVVSTVTLIRAEARAVLISAAVPRADLASYQDAINAIVASVRLSIPAAPVAAGPIVYGEKMTGEVTSLRGVAWTLKGATGDAVDIVVTPEDEELDVTLDVLDSDGKSILAGGAVDEAFGPERISNLILPADGEYHIVVRGFAGSTGDYSLTVDVRSGGGVMTDEALVLGLTYQGRLERDSLDRYVLPDLGGTNVTLEVTPEAGLDVVVEVFSPDDGLALSVDDGFSGAAERLAFPSSGGVVEIRGFAGDSGDYTLRLAESGASGEGVQIVARGELGSGDDAGHAFPFFAPAGATVTATILPETAFDIVAEVWDDDAGELLDTVDLAFESETITFTTRREGNYSVVVRGFEQQRGPYTITLTGPAAVLFELAAGDDVSATLDEAALVEFLIALRPGETVVITATPDAGSDAVLEISGLDRNLLASADEYFPGGPETITFTAPQDSADDTLYVIGVSDYNGVAGGEFRLTVD
jgi:hypothetical protein